jgi:hypothetical protein
LPHHYNKDDIEERFGFAMAAVQHAFKSRAKTFQNYTIPTLSPTRDNDGKLVVNGEVTHKKMITQMIQHTITRLAIIHSGGASRTYRDFPYVLMDEFDLNNKDTAEKMRLTTVFSIARMLGMPINLLPLAKGQCQEHIFGIFDLCYGADSFTCNNGIWPFGGIANDLAKQMYTNDFLPESRRWTINGNFGDVQRLVIFEKVSLAHQF